MTIAEKILRAKADYDEVYEAGKNSGGGADSYYDTFWDAYQENGNRVNYHGAFAGTGWTAKTFKPKHTIRPTAAIQMFWNFNKGNNKEYYPLLDFTPFNDLLDFSAVKDFSSFMDNARISNVFVDLSSATNVTRAFASENGGTIDYLTLRVTSSLTSYSSTFSAQRNMRHVYFTEDSVIAGSLSFGACPSLAKDSITSIFNALSASTSGNKLTLVKIAVEKAFETSNGANDGTTSAEWTTLVNSKSNWTISLF